MSPNKSSCASLGCFAHLASFLFLLTALSGSPAFAGDVLAQAALTPDAGRTNFNPSILPTDATPAIFNGQRGFLSREMQFNLLRKLPERMWFNSTTEVSQRLETNPAFVATDAHADYVFRVAPNVTLGYDVLKNTGVYCNYFLIKDQFARQSHFGLPTTQSLACGVRRTAQFTQKTSGQLDLQARELWQSRGLRQFDFLPSISLTHVATPNVILFGSTLLQMRGRNYFVAPTRELDPFYSAGVILRRKQWNLILSDTFVTNFRHSIFKNPVPHQGNLSMIADAEINHPISNKYLPGAVAFVRAEPVWNWRSQRVPGLSGFDFRLFAGIRVTLNKPAYDGTIDSLRKNIREYHQNLKTQGTQPSL